MEKLLEKEVIIDKLSLTQIKRYNSAMSFMRTSVPFSIKLTNKAIYSYIFWRIPVGKILLKNIISFKRIKNELVGFSFFKEGIVLKSIENDKIKEVAILFIRKSRVERFSKNLESLGVKETN
jgi:hypothetical protein